MDDFINKILRFTPVVSFLMMIKDMGQERYDKDRVYYSVEFPLDMSQESIEDFIRSIGKNLIGGSRWKGVPSIAFEIWASPTGIKPRLRVPRRAAAYLESQLRGAINGIDLNEIKGEEDTDFHVGAVIHMANPSEALSLNTVKGLSNRVLRSLQNAVESGDTVVVQWVIAHSYDQRVPPSDEPVKTLRGISSREANRDEVNSRRIKQADQNFLAIGRVAARAETVERAHDLAELVVRAYISEGGMAYLYDKQAKPHVITHDVLAAKTPLHFTAQFSVSELTGVIGWPIGSEYFPGLTRGTIMHLPAQENVPREGIVIGKSTIRGIDRPIALSAESPVTHTYLGGATNTGKTTLFVNTIRQKMDSGWGVIVVERDGNLIRQSLDEVPRHRMQDVVVIDMTDQTRPIGFNLLRTNKPEVVAGQLATLLDALYPDNRSIYTNQLVRMGVPVLCGLEKATISDLLPLVEPRNPSEKAWVHSVIAGIKDKTYKDFWEDWHGKDAKTIARDAQAFKNRMLELLTPEPVRYLLNQETSSFDPLDIINDNKLLFVNLAGISEQAAGLIGTMLINTLYTAAQRSKPDIPNALYVDEFQQFAHLTKEFEDMFATARKRDFELNVATQYIERLPRAIQDAVMANAGNKLILQSSVGSASLHAQEFASTHIRKEHFVNLPLHTMLARVRTSTGISDPMTVRTYPEPGASGSFLPAGYGHGREALALSARVHGRTIADIEHADRSRRVASHSEPTPTAQPIGGRKYGE